MSVVVAPTSRADEVDELVEKLDPPARFEDHSPQWSVQKRTYSFEHVSGPRKMDWWVIMDGPRYVALIPTSGFHGGTIYLQHHDPAKAPRKLQMPSERWHIDTAKGAELKTDAFIPVSENSKDGTYEFSVDGQTLVLRRRWSGEAKFNKWSHRTNKPIKAKADHTFVLKCHPVFGYMVDGTYRTAASETPKAFQFTSHAVSGRYALWPGEATAYRTVVTPKGSDEGYVGYYLNIAAIAHGGLSCRDGGFGAYLNDKTGWSWATTTKGADARIVVCNAHADLDFVSRWPGELEPIDDGLKQHVHRHRLLALPPELTRHVWQKMEVKFKDRHKVQIRVGRTEDFEDQPLPLTTRQRGLTFTSGGPDITTEHAHSGKRSMVIEGTVWPNVPQLVLEPNTTYRLTAMIKVQAWDEQRLAAAEAKARARLEKQNRKRRKKGEPLKSWAGLGETEAYISANLYEWTPHSNKWLVRQRTSSASPEASGWQEVELQFTAPKYGPFVDIRFVARNCTAYVDDFRFVALEEAKAGSAR